MPCDGSIILSDVGSPTLGIGCEPCGRRGRHSVERLIAEHGPDVKAARSSGDAPQLPQGTVITIAVVRDESICMPQR